MSLPELERIFISKVLGLIEAIRSGKSSLMLTTYPWAREGRVKRGRELVSGGVTKRPVSGAGGLTGSMKGSILPLQGWKMPRESVNPEVVGQL